MISESWYENDTPMQMTKIKRDEFLIDIRKKKSQGILLKKRIKLYGSCFQSADSMQEEIFTDHEAPFEETDTSYSDIQSHLDRVRDDFFYQLDQKNWSGLVPCIKEFRECLLKKPEFVKGSTIIQTGIVPSLIALLSKDFEHDEVLQIQTTWLLANISAGDNQESYYLVQENILPALSDCLKNSKNEELRENAMWCFANISGEPNLEFRDIIIENKVLDFVVRDLGTTPKTISYYRTATWLMSNSVRGDSARGDPYPPFEKIEDCFGQLTHLIMYKDEGIQTNSLQCLIFLTEEGLETHLKKMQAKGIIPKVLSLLSHHDEKVVFNAVKVVGNLARTSKSLSLSENEVFKAMPDILKSKNPNLRREACMTLSYIFDKDFEDHDLVVDYEILPTICEIIDQDCVENQIEASLCLSQYLINCPKEDAIKVIEKGITESLFRNLQSHSTKLIDNSLQVLYKLLDHGDNMLDMNQGNPLIVAIYQNNYYQILEVLHQHPDENIGQKIEVIFNRFFRSDFEM